MSCGGYQPAWALTGSISVSRGYSFILHCPTSRCHMIDALQRQVSPSWDFFSFVCIESYVLLLVLFFKSNHASSSSTDVSGQRNPHSPEYRSVLYSSLEGDASFLFWIGLYVQVLTNPNYQCNNICGHKAPCYSLFNRCVFPSQSTSLLL